MSPLEAMPSPYSTTSPGHQKLAVLDAIQPGLHRVEHRLLGAAVRSGRPPERVRRLDGHAQLVGGIRRVVRNVARRLRRPRP